MYDIQTGYTRSLWAAEGDETYTACRVPSQSKLFIDWFPYKILLFEVVYGIAHDEISRDGSIPSSAIAGVFIVE